MPKEKPKLSYTLEEILGHAEVPEVEIEISRTNDMTNSEDPNWESTWSKWSMGLRNSNDTKLANIMERRIPNPFGILEFMDFVRWSQMQLYDFMTRIVDRILAKKENDVSVKDN